MLWDDSKSAAPKTDQIIMSRTALTTESTGQDDPYLAERGTAEKYVEVHAGSCRATEIRELWGDASRPRSKLGRTPATDFPTIVETMVESDLIRMNGG